VKPVKTIKRLLSPGEKLSGRKLLIICAVLVAAGVGVVLITRASVPVYNTNWAFWGSRIRGCESGSGPGSGPNYNAQNRTSTASGAYQFLDGTWGSYKGYAKARLAPPEIQEEKAFLTFMQSGTSPWDASYFCWQGTPPQIPAGPLPTVLRDQPQTKNTDLVPLVPGTQDVTTEATTVHFVSTAPADGFDPYIGSPIIHLLRFFGFLRG
jgi:hypothetical protein